jgi:nucleotide-binding universal stress UspA family protein
MSQDAAVERTLLLARQVRAAPPVIVVGLDGSPTSWDAFFWAAGEALGGDGTLVAVYVLPVAEPAAAFAVPFDYASVEYTRQQVARELKDEAERRARQLGVSVTFVSEYGDATDVLTDVARRVRAHLVVVGRSAKALHHLAGSLSHRLTCRKDAPVVVVVP